MLLVLVMFSLCLPVASSWAVTGDKVITGAGAHFSWTIMNDLQQQLEDATGRKIRLFGRESAMGAGCNAGIKLAQSSTPENETFGLVCCPLSQQEVHDKKLRVFPLALEPIMILAHKSNPVNNLSSAQVRAIFSGKITNWKQVGGDDRGIVVVTRLHCKKRPGHWKTILPNVKAFSQKRINVKSAADMVRRINDFKGGFGHTGSAWLFNPNDQIKIITVDGYKPTAKNLKAGHYPFYRKLSAVTSLEPSADVLNVIHNAQKLLINSITAARYEVLPLGVGEQK
jgi:ABC-type phosphate transport system substrate-binding protein